MLTSLTGQVKLSERRLKEDFLPENADAVYHNVTVDGILAGHVFACRWKVNDKQVCWVTQLVVNRDHRNRGLASTLLRSLRTDKDDLYGIMSSHPAAITAAAKAFGCEQNIAQGRSKHILTLTSSHYKSQSQPHQGRWKRDHEGFAGGLHKKSCPLRVLGQR